GVTRRTYPSYGLPDARAGAIGGAQHGARPTRRQVGSELAASRRSTQNLRSAQISHGGWAATQTGGCRGSVNLKTPILVNSYGWLGPCYPCDSCSQHRVRQRGPF